jgi:hypothetical protein
MKVFPTILLVIIAIAGAVIYSHWPSGGYQVAGVSEPVVTQAASAKSPVQLAEEMHANAVRNLALETARAIANAQRDPDSIQWRAASIMPDDTICFDYSSTNAFNARVRAAAVVLPKSKKIMLDSNETRRIYNAKCIARGTDIKHMLAANL